MSKVEVITTIKRLGVRADFEGDELVTSRPVNLLALETAIGLPGSLQAAGAPDISVHVVPIAPFEEPENLSFGTVVRYDAESVEQMKDVLRDTADLGTIRMDVKQLKARADDVDKRLEDQVQLNALLTARLDDEIESRAWMRIELTDMQQQVSVLNSKMALCSNALLWVIPRVAEMIHTTDVVGAKRITDIYTTLVDCFRSTQKTNDR